MGPKEFKMVMDYLTRIKKVKPDLPEVFPASQAPVPPKKESLETMEAINEFVLRNPRQDMSGGGRIKFDDGSKLKGRNKGTTKAFYDESTGHIYPRTNRFGTFYSDTPAGGIKRNLITDDVGKLIIEEYKDGASTVKLSDKYGFNKDTINRYIKKNAPGILRTASQGINQYNFDKSVIDEIVADAPNMSRKMILEKYGDRISKKKLDSLKKEGKITYGIVEEAGRPRVLPGERSPKQVKRANRIRNAQGFDVSGTFQKNFHHIFPIGGLSKLSAQDVMILDKKFNETLGGFNLQLNDIADEIGSMDLSDPNALKKLNDLNAKSKDIVNKAKEKLPKKLQNAIGYIEYNPVFDENGTIFELSQVRKGVDAPMGALPKEFGTKKFKDYTPEEIKNFKTRVKQLALQAEDNRTTFAAKIPIIQDIMDVARSIPGDVAKKSYFKAAGKVAGLAFTPVMLYDTYKALEQGKPLIESLEQGLIGTNMIGGTKDILSLNPEERMARSVVKQDALKNLNLDMPMGFGFIEGPTPQTNMTLPEAQQKMDAGIQRVQQERAQKESDIAANRANFFGNLRDRAFGIGPDYQLELAGGGIAKEAGDPSGAMLESMNPDSQGLPGLLKRVRNR
jgi:hypothetical protein